MGDIKEHKIEIRTHVSETESNIKSADIPYIGSKFCQKLLVPK